MTTFYVSFPIGGPRANNYTTIDATDEALTRRAVIDAYGTDGFCSIYLSAEDLGVERFGLTHIEFGR